MDPQPHDSNEEFVIPNDPGDLFDPEQELPLSVVEIFDENISESALVQYSEGPSVGHVMRLYPCRPVGARWALGPAHAAVCYATNLTRIGHDDLVRSSSSCAFLRASSQHAVWIQSA
jgi:hypothetical protein